MADAIVDIDSEEESNISQNSDNKLKETFKWKNYIKCVNDSKNIKCVHCYKKFSANTSGTNLKKHYKQFHEKVAKNEIKKYLIEKIELKEQKTLNERILDFIICGQHSFSIVKEKNLLSYYNH